MKTSSSFRYWAVFLMLLAIGTFSLKAQNEANIIYSNASEQSPLDINKGYYLNRGLVHINDKTRNYIKFPYDFSNNLVIVPLQINNSDTLNFVLDSGVNSTIITELAYTDSISLKNMSLIQVFGHGNGEPLIAYKSTGNYFTMHDIKGNNQHLYVLSENLLQLSSKLGFNINGIIGYHLFKHFIVEIDYTRHFIIFYSPGNYHKRYYLRKSIEIPIEIINNKPFVNVEITMSDSVTIPVKLLIDTGSSDALWLYQNSDSRIYVPGKSIDSYLGHGLNGDIYGKYSYIKNLKIGNYILKNPKVAFPDTAYIKSLPGNDINHGIIGADILRRFTIVFNYPEQKMLLRPNKNFNEPFTFNLSGIDIVRPIVNLPYYEIAHIRDNSPADKAGLMVGDQILKINNNYKVDNHFIGKVNSLFHCKSGKRIRVKVFRDGQKMTKSFRLESLF